jgi:methionyl-tRNA formyltransferase
MMSTPWRVVILTMLPQIVDGYAALVRGLGHEPVAAVSARRRAFGEPATPFAAPMVADVDERLDVVFASRSRSLARVFRAFEPDLVLCTGFPWLVPAEAIAVPRLGIVNGHPSLLPRYRGPFPVAWAVRKGETEIGLSYHLMDAQFDTGPLLAQTRFALDDGDDMMSIQPRLAAAAQELLPIVFDRLARGERGDEQEGGDYFSHFEEAYSVVDTTSTAEEVHRQVRAWRFIPPIMPQRGPWLERAGGRVRLLRTSLEEVQGAEVLDCADRPLWIVECEPA